MIHSEQDGKEAAVRLPLAMTLRIGSYPMKRVGIALAIAVVLLTAYTLALAQYESATSRSLHGAISAEEPQEP